MQPAGKYLGEEYYRAGGLPAVLHELIEQKRIHADALTINGRTIGENDAQRQKHRSRRGAALWRSTQGAAGFKVLKGNLFDSAIMKLSVISEEFRARYLSDPEHPNAFEGRAVVFDGPEDYHARIDDPTLAIDTHTLLVRPRRRSGRLSGVGRGREHAAAGGAAQTGHHLAPLHRRRRQSGTSGSPSILNASPEAAVGGGLALLKTGDRVRIDLNRGTADMVVDDAELAPRRAALEKDGGYRFPESQTPWQEIQRAMVDQLADGMVLKPAVKYQRVAQKYVPRNSH